VIRKLTSLGLAEAKEFTTSPKALKKVYLDEAEETKARSRGYCNN
jgi:ribosomal protein L7/L12